jgi:hypothetical protein
MSGGSASSIPTTASTRPMLRTRWNSGSAEFWNGLPGSMRINGRRLPDDWPAPSRRRPERAGPGSAVRQSDGESFDRRVAAKATAAPGEVGPSYRLFGILPPRMGGVVVHAFITASLVCGRARKSALGGKSKCSVDRWPDGCLCRRRDRGVSLRVATSRTLLHSGAAHVYFRRLTPRCNLSGAGTGACLKKSWIN